ncbi:MAG: hypothetical protein IV090_02170 [Candidatus Sericytochromatia bacterium]|nr:hypothetical protein [Candidatus Sericytochromatia bacterium]
MVLTQKLKSGILIASTFCLVSLPLTACNGLSLGQIGQIGQTDSGIYGLPLKLIHEGECQMPSYTRYEVKADGTFSFAEVPAPGSMETTQPPLQSRMLSNTEQNKLKTLLKKLDLAQLAKADKVVPEGSPQTADCRTIEVAELLVNGKATRFDSNGRKLIHTQAYSAAMKELREFLDALKNNPTPDPSPSPSVQPNLSEALPLKVTGNGECDMGEQLLYEVLPAGLFRFQADPNASVTPGGPQTGLQTRQLTSQELSELTNLVAELKLEKLRAESKPVPEDAPQTLECRTIKNFSLRVGNETKTYDLNGRKFVHTEAYRNALIKLDTHLKTLADRHQNVGKKLYTLPLKVNVEGECGLESFTRYDLKANGSFTWALENAQTLVAGPPPVQSRTLSNGEIESVQKLLNSTALQGLFLQLEAIPADAPQTKECRSIEKLEVTVNGQNYLLEGRGTRKYRISEAYSKALGELQSLLERLAK